MKTDLQSPNQTLPQKKNNGLNEKMILLVDDEPLNLKMMTAMLSREGYRILVAQNGKEALTKATELPDLILMDIMMPELNGLETCRILKEDEACRDIPIIFLSAFQDSDTKVTGLNLGGVDYIIKPFHREELLARVRTHLVLREQEMRLREYAEHLEEMVEQRTRQLVHADRLATLGTLVAAVAHEFNNPLQVIRGNAELGGFELDKLKNSLAGSFYGPAKEELKSLIKNVESCLVEINKGCQRLNENKMQLNNFGKRETIQNDHFQIILPIQDALDIMRPRLKGRVTVEVHVPMGLEVYGNRLQFSQIFINLIHNALDALAEEEGKITLSAEADQNGRIIIDVIDSGLGIPEEVGKKIFDPFYTTKDEIGGTGLGLFITQKIVENHQGQIETIPHSGQGAWFQIILPEYI
jgi:two-component system, NtrC family, sensor kinase